MVVLHQDDGIRRLGLLGDGVGEFPVRLVVLLPIGRAEGRSNVGDVAQGPQPLVGEAVVVARLLLVRQPDAAEVVRRLSGRDHDVVVRVHDLTVGRPAAVGDPRPRAGAHHRLQGGDQPARRPGHLDAVAAARVDIRLAVRHDEDVLAAKVVVQDGPQRLRRPVHLALVAGPVFGLHVPDQRAQVAGDGAKFGKRGLGSRPGRPQQPFAPQEGADAFHPSPPAQLRDHHRDQGDDRAESDEEEEHVTLRLLAAPLHEAHVVNQHQVADPGADASMPTTATCSGPLSLGASSREGSVNRSRSSQPISRGEGLGRDLRPVRRAAKTERIETFVLDDLVEERSVLAFDPLLNESWIESWMALAIRFERMSMSCTNHRSVRPVHQRHDRVRDGRQGQRQGNDESQRQAHGFAVIPLAWPCPGRRLREECSPRPGRGIAGVPVGFPDCR